MRARILLADDHSITLTGMRTVIEQEHDLVGEVRDGRSLVKDALRLRPDLIVLDIGMPLLNGIEAARQIRDAWPSARFLFVTMHANALYFREAMSIGASGYLLKSSASEELLPAIRTILSGRVFASRGLGRDVLESVHSEGAHTRARGLTGRQREVLQLVAEGRSGKEVASILNISVKTAEFHRNQVMKKLGVRSIAELAAFAVREGIIG
jgi:DNA-binding NarL/FixJ family response regulator